MKLSLKKEQLTELTTDELHAVAGAGPDATRNACVSVGGGCHSVQQACTTAITCSCQATETCA